MGRVARLRADLAAWFNGSTIANTEMDALDERCFKAISETGGTYALEDPLIIGGDDVTFTEDTNFDGDIEANDGINLNVGGLYVKSGAWLSWLAGSHGTIYSGAYLDVEALGEIRVQSTGMIHVLAGGSITVSSTGGISFATGGVLSLSGSANYPVLSSRSVTRQARAPWVIDSYGPLEFGDFEYDSENGYWLCARASQRRIGIHETIESNATLTSVTVYVKGATHSVWPPDNLPAIALLKLDASTGVASPLGLFDDTSATKSAYEAVHPITSTPGALSATFGAHEKLLIVLYTESGTDAVSGMRIFDAELTMTFTELRAV